MPVASFPALLPEATWRAIRERYGVPKRRTKQRDGWERPDDTVPTGRPPARYLLSGGIARCANCGGPLTVAPDNQGQKRYRCDRRGRDQCWRGVSIRVADLDTIVTERFLILAGNLYAADVQEVTTAPDAARRADAIRQAERAMFAADDADDATVFAAARALRRSLRAELDALPTAAVTTRQRVISTSTYAERWAALDGDTDARRELLRPLVTVTVAPATERTATGHYDNSPEALARRVRHRLG